jgi:hypothetical protein
MSIYGKKYENDFEKIKPGLLNNLLGQKWRIGEKLNNTSQNRELKNIY